MAECSFCDKTAVKKIEGFFEDGENTGLAYVDVCPDHFSEYEQWENGDKGDAHFYWHGMSSMESIEDVI